MKHKIYYWRKSQQMRLVKYHCESLVELDGDHLLGRLTRSSGTPRLVNCSTHQLDVMTIPRNHPETVARRLCRQATTRQSYAITRHASVAGSRSVQRAQALRGTRSPFRGPVVANPSLSVKLGTTGR